ncbi:MAG TPA: TGS domain-containing protein [Dehalococcoidia bacterium]|nr:TGS domain-containing protein [Dehalococcoidia bacterium]
MPANLTPAYFEAEKRFREAKANQDKIAALEEMLAVMPKHKGTDHLKADLRRKIAKLTQASERKTATQRASMVLPKEGAAQVVIVGLPNAGKSQLVDGITKATPTVADYPFTTQNATPGMMEFENIKIQLVDMPPLVSGSTQFWVPPMLRRADALIIMVDLSDTPLDQLVEISMQLEELKIGIGEKKSEEEAPGWTWKKALIIGSKLDLPEENGTAEADLQALRDEYKGQVPVLGISAKNGTGLEDLRLKVFEVLDIIRVYTKTPGQKPDLNDPIILERGSTLADAAEDVHKDFRAKLKFARLWGSGKHDGVMVKRDHVLEDGDIIELHI